MPAFEVLRKQGRSLPLMGIENTRQPVLPPGGHNSLPLMGIENPSECAVTPESHAISLPLMGIENREASDMAALQRALITPHGD